MWYKPLSLYRPLRTWVCQAGYYPVSWPADCWVTSGQHVDSLSLIAYLSLPGLRPLILGRSSVVLMRLSETRSSARPRLKIADRTKNRTRSLHARGSSATRTPWGLPQCDILYRNFFDSCEISAEGRRGILNSCYSFYSSLTSLGITPPFEVGLMKDVWPFDICRLDFLTSPPTPWGTGQV